MTETATHPWVGSVQRCSSRGKVLVLPQLDPAALGLPLQAFLAVRAGPHHRPVVDQFVAYVLAQSHTRAAYLVAGPDDFLIHVTARDVEDLQRVAVDALTLRPEVMSVRTNLVFQAWHGGPLLPPT